MHQHYRAIFISDIHLGSPDCKAEYLLECLNQFTCDKLYLVGDIIDLWYMQKQFKWPEAHNAVFHKLIELSHGPTQVIYLPGNHDRPLQRYDGLSIGKAPSKLSDPDCNRRTWRRLEKALSHAFRTLDATA